MNEQEHKTYFHLFWKLNDIFSPFYWDKGLNCPQKDLFENFSFCYWEIYRNGNGNVDPDSVSSYLDCIREVGHQFASISINDDGTTNWEFDKIFDDEKCQQIREDLAVVELKYLLISSEFMPDKIPRDLLKSISPNIANRDPYEGLMCRVVDWCRANPVITCDDIEEEEDAAEQYRQLLL